MIKLATALATVLVVTTGCTNNAPSESGVAESSPALRTARGMYIIPTVLEVAPATPRLSAVDPRLVRTGNGGYVPPAEGEVQGESGSPRLADADDPRWVGTGRGGYLDRSDAAADQ